MTAYGAIELAQKRPDMISHLVLPQAPGWEEMMKWKVGRDPKGLLSIPIVSQLLLQVLKRKRTPSWFQKALGDKALLEPFNEIAQTAYIDGASFNLASAFQRFLIGPLPLSGIVSQPSLFVWGDKGRSHCHTCKESSKSLIESANIVHIPEAGHFPELETPAKFSEHLENFYRESL